jgi:hypothetical protein
MREYIQYPVYPSVLHALPGPRGGAWRGDPGLLDRGYADTGCEHPRTLIPRTRVNEGPKPPRIGCSDTHMGEDHPTPDSHNEDAGDEHYDEASPEESDEHGYLGKAYSHAGDHERDHSP